MLKLLLSVLASLTLLVGGASLATWKNSKDLGKAKESLEEVQQKYESKARECDELMIELDSLKNIQEDN